MAISPTQYHSPPPVHPQLFRNLSRSPPSSRTSPRLHPTTPPLAHSLPTTMPADTADFRPTMSVPTSPVTTNRDGSNIKAEYMLPPPSILPSGDVPVLSASSTTNGTGSPDQVPCHQCPDGRSGTPRAKFIQTLQGKSAWDALIHGSFSWCWCPCTLDESYACHLNKVRSKRTSGSAFPILVSCCDRPTFVME